ncbi:MAG: hypothetical protein ACIALR_11475 [Blastopirellula sp. JB062]
MVLNQIQQIEALQTRRDAVLTQIAALTDGEVGGGPDTSGPGDHVRQVAYRQSLYDELARIDQALSRLRGAWATRRQGRLR